MSECPWGAKAILRLTLSAVLLATSWSLSGSAQAPTAQAFQQLLDRAEASSRDRQWSEAAALWSKVVEINPVVASYWNQLGIARYNNRDYRGAIEAYRKAKDLGVWPALMAYNIASCYGAVGEKQQALSWLEQSLALGYTRPRRALQDQDLKLLWDEPRFRALVGADGVSRLSRVEGWRYHLDFFVRELKRMHPNPYRQTSREEFDTYVSTLRNDVPKLNRTR